MDLLVSRFCKSRSSRLAPTKLVPLSERIVEGQPLLSVNLESAARNASEVRSDTSSMCTALVVQQINKQEESGPMSMATSNEERTSIVDAGYSKWR